MDALQALFRFHGFRWFVALVTGVSMALLALGAGASLNTAIVLAATPPGWVSARERLRLCRGWRRWFATGRGAAGDWMSPVDLKRHTHPFPEKLP